MHPDATIAQPFNRITGFSELKDGRALVVDANDQSVTIVDFAQGSTTQVGRLGSGPGEYLFPYRVFSLGSDSIGIEDGGNGRILVFVAPKGLVGTLGPSGGSSSDPPTSQMYPPRASDGRGNLYAVAYSPFTPPQLQVHDSAAILRWRIGSMRRDTVAFLPLSRTDPEAPGRGSVAFATAPQWVVGVDGRVAITRPDPYSVQLIDASGTRVVGQMIPNQRIAVNAELKRQWREEQTRRFPVTMMTPNGKQSAGLRVWTPVEPVQWPKNLPPFFDKATRFAPDGRLWIQRTVPAGEPELFDVVSERGVLVARVRTPPRTRLIGFGNAHLYLARLDPDNQEFLERYKPPQEARR